MIPRAHIAEWRAVAPWQLNEQVEQDLLLSRALIEINCREHFTTEGTRRVPYSVQSRWAPGECELPTYGMEELLATKTRALYQRRKGRDLFDLWHALTQAEVDCERVVAGFAAYVANDGLAVSGEEYRDNMERKLNHPDFVHDTEALLRPDIVYNPEEAWDCVHSKLISLME